MLKKFFFPKGHENLKSIRSGFYSVSVFVDIERQIPPQGSPCYELSIGINADTGGISNPASQYDTGAFRYRTGSPYFSTGLAPS